MESRPSWEPNLSVPWLSAGFRSTIRSTKIASRASQGHRDPTRSPQEDRPTNKNKKIGPSFWKVDPLGNPILQFPGSLRALDQPFVQQRLPLQLPRATGSPQGAHKRTDQKRIFVIFFLAAVGRKVGPLGELFGRLPGPLRALRPLFDQQIMPPELPGTHRMPQGPPPKKKKILAAPPPDLRRSYPAGRTSLGTCATC